MKKFYNLFLSIPVIALLIILFNSCTDQIYGETLNEINLSSLKLSDDEIYNLIEDDLKSINANFESETLNIKQDILFNQEYYAIADMDISVYPWYKNNSNDVVGVILKGIGIGFDQNGLDIESILSCRINFRNGRSWGKQLVKSPGAYVLGLKQTMVPRRSESEVLQSILHNESIINNGSGTFKKSTGTLLREVMLYTHFNSYKDLLNSIGFSSTMALNGETRIDQT